MARKTPPTPSLIPESPEGRFGPSDMVGKLGLESFDTSHLKGKAKKVADLLNRHIFAPHPCIFSGRGCTTYHMSEDGRELEIVFDGGDLYDMLSIDGEGEYMGIGIHYQTCDFLNSHGFNNEPHSGWKHCVYL